MVHACISTVYAYYIVYIIYTCILYKLAIIIVFNNLVTVTSYDLILISTREKSKGTNAHEHCYNNI